VPRIDIDGLGIAYERAGEGPPIVLLHGGVSDGREWRRQIEALASEYTLVAWDAPGNRRSDDPPESFRMPDYADCLARLIGALELDRPHVVGLSFGATLALELYRRHPGEPRSLVLLGGYAGWAGSLPPEVVAERLADVERDLAQSPQTLARSFLATLLTDSAPAELADELLAILVDLHPAGALAQAHAMAEADLRDVLPDIAVPTLLLYGEQDVRSPRAVAGELAAQIPDAELVLIPGAGHMLNMEAADRVNAELLRFLGAI
jgi:pimeloyl-ACP methyl ester carboxylesterase